MFHSRIADAGIRVAPGIAAEDRGATLLQTTDETDSGGGAEEENEVGLFFDVPLVVAS